MHDISGCTERRERRTFITPVYGDAVHTDVDVSTSIKSHKRKSTHRSIEDLGGKSAIYTGRVTTWGALVDHRKPRTNVSESRRRFNRDLRESDHATVTDAYGSLNTDLV